MKLKALSVSEVNSYIKRILTNDPILYNLKVKGEVSNLKVHTSGHIYMSLKDNKSKINCVIFKNNVPKDLNLEEGLKVRASGYISLYEKDGSYQLYINSIDIEGLGNLHVEFEKLKQKLKSDGLFDPKYKKKIPSIPQNIGVITSLTGAALRDIINVISRRYPKVNIKIYPVLVQGDKSADDIVNAIDFLNKRQCIDVIILARGGGSIEELWSFNEEKVARSIFKSQIPIISAVGHETDFTISDFVADLRAPTPSAGAEISVPFYLDIRERLDTSRKRINKIFENKVYTYKKDLDSTKKDIEIGYKEIIKDKLIEMDNCLKDIENSINRKLILTRNELEYIGQNLNNLSPLSIMSRGYTLVEKDDKLVKNPKNLKQGDNINVLFEKACLNCKIQNIKEVD
ncbi:MAG: exodeoxyribonuclease VII large subunit [Tepidibacter sp.]|jgi:exodeoxyribonuclease VII large subunit|uniref:exodeoxyribonuclease VII large subunit n=1 Tax=Tepidibacter sp. TaxID=2529387 RepID=UPI0025DB52CF|nr:exodeoxyribonuclease VII large subunit [Tepidibacter sp.]MCT4508164.1 exodeoxyribonuclease VII large subunit [Tepidibacter sp.]